MNIPTFVFLAPLLILPSCDGAFAQTAAPRIEIPIKQTALADGNIRYSIPINVGGGPEIDAMLDSGSTGVRVQSGTLAAESLGPPGRSSIYAYGSGVRLVGNIADATVTLAGQSTAAPIAIEIVRSVSCIDSRPHCPASRISQAGYGIGGDGIPKQGFKAIVGTSLRAADADNPLLSIGNGEWIIQLPLPGDAAPGRLILNPDAIETKGYVMFHLESARQNTAIPGCLLNSDASTKVCGNVELDTGTSGLLVEAPEQPSPLPWAEGSHVIIGFENELNERVEAQFVLHIGDASPFNPTAVPAFLRSTRISGTVPFFVYSVLYDGRNGAIGLKPR